MQITAAIKGKVYVLNASDDLEVGDLQRFQVVYSLCPLLRNECLFPKPFLGRLCASKFNYSSR